jgi:hypothetical protein
MLDDFFLRWRIQCSSICWTPFVDKNLVLPRCQRALKTSQWTSQAIQFPWGIDGNPDAPLDFAFCINLYCSVSSIVNLCQFWFLVCGCLSRKVIKVVKHFSLPFDRLSIATASDPRSPAWNWQIRILWGIVWARIIRLQPFATTAEGLCRSHFSLCQ